MKTGIPHEGKLCGARTRRGTACARRPMRNGRCNLHGGKSRAWFFHPNFKHGRYSKYSMARIDARHERQRAAVKRDFERELAKLPDGTIWDGRKTLALLRKVNAQHRRRGWFVKR